MTSDISELPVLDVGSLFATEPHDRASLVQEFARIYGEIGFGYIVNHGIDPVLRQAVFDASKQFHALPLEQKMTIELDSRHRGYIPIDTSTDVNSKLANVTKPNQSASFMLMREDENPDPDVYLSGPNQWPDVIGFRETCGQYVKAMTELGNGLMRVALEACGAESGDFIRSFDTPTTWLRLLHYPPQPQAPDDLYGSAPHTDFGCLTILAQDPVGGLQVQTPSGDWIDAPYVENSFVVNVGDMLHRLSNGRLLSTPHRVLNRSGAERYSIPFFYDPHALAEIKPLVGTGQPQFDPVIFGGFLRAELEAGYDKHRSSESNSA